MLVEPSHAWTPAQKLMMIAAVAVAIIAIGAAIFVYQRQHRPKPATGIEQVQDLGSGFRQVTIAKSNKGETNRYSLFYYKDTLICQIGVTPPSISPSGNYAICQDVRTGKLILFRRLEEKAVTLTPTSFGLPSGFQWNEQEGTVEAKAGGEFSSIFNLQ